MDNFVQNKIIDKPLFFLRFNISVVQYESKNISPFHSTMLETKEQHLKVSPSEKWNCRASILLHKLLSANDRLPLCNMSNNLVMDVVKN